MDDSQKIESKLHLNGGSKPVEKCAGNKAMSGKGKAAEIALLCLVMAVIWVSLALPVVIFYLPEDALSGADPASCSGETCEGVAEGSGQMAAMDQMAAMEGSGQFPGNTTEGDITLVCSEDFFIGMGPNGSAFCTPHCPSWGQHPLSVTKLVDKIVLVCSLIGVVSAVIVLLISCIRHKHMFSFPAIFVVYLTITLLVLGIFSVINFIDREHLFCTSPSLLQSIADPSTFCIIAGVVFYYSLVQITLWWFFHIAALFWAFRFPLHFRSFQKLKRIKYVHIVCVVLGVVVPVLPVVVTIGVNEREGTRNGFGFGMTNFPPILCAGLDSNASFYSLVLPITLMAEVGMTLLVFTFWDVRKHHNFRKTINRNGCFKTFSAGEKKIVIVFLYYALLVDFSLMAFTLALANLTQFQDAVTANFGCEIFGGSNSCDRSRLESLKYPSVNILAYMLLELFPVINFTYVIKFRVLKRWFCVYVLRRKAVKLDSTQYHRSESSSSTAALKRMNFASNGSFGTSWSVNVDHSVDQSVFRGLSTEV